MATALSATYQAGTSTYPPRVLLQVTGAPTLTPPYTSNFATVDGWTANTGSITVDTSTDPDRLRLLSQADAASYYQRTVTGLTIGATYRVGLWAQKTSGRIAIGVGGIGATAYTEPSGTTYKVWIEYSWTATATSHNIQAYLQPKTTQNVDYADYYIDTVSVNRTSSWQGTRIYVSDDNRAGPEVRKPVGGLDATGTSGSGTMTLYDYEVSLVPRSVAYSVKDGNGTVVNTSVTIPASAGVWLSLPATSTDLTSSTAPPTFLPVELVTNYSESSESNGSIHEIIGRDDPIANPGPLALRAGTYEFWCADYATAKAVRTLLANGDVAMLRQPSFPGADSYFVGTRVEIRPAEPSVPRRWIASIDYQEVASP